MIKTDFSIKPLKDAYLSLDAATSKIKINDLERDGIIQRFEYSFELTWKTLKKYLESYCGISENNIKNIFREAARVNIIDDIDIWFAYLRARNETSHIYNSEIAKEVYTYSVSFSKDLKVLIEKLESLL